MLSRRLPIVIVTIVAVAGGLTFYQNFEYYCLVRSYCQGTQLYSRCLPVYSEAWFGNRENPFSPLFRQFISLCVLVHAMTMIILPIVLLTVMNLMLLFALRKRLKNLTMTEDRSERQNNKSQLHMQRTEHRVTLTVTFIVTMFTITNGPSAFMHLIRTAYNLKQQDLYDLTMILSLLTLSAILRYTFVLFATSITLVICGKASNFILFCLGSRHFRLRLMKLTRRKVFRKIESLSGNHLSNRASTSRRQSDPPKKCSIVNPCGSPRNYSTLEMYRPLVKEISKNFGSHS
ncbi:hypothetical protein DICVIV_09164 [Dictyocaulus viviparus]|uniref:G-protein coupled receptors family 1 profile domain-containing protein n=1 Tax=Dictyocaulus viviparus TaxID=29172 RepID=A0A0D8XM36_DICVI|nr:hypothetical protein DICVIV_09164 [Dictyocaulus viviparus]